MSKIQYITSYDKLPKPESITHKILTLLQENKGKTVDFTGSEWNNINVRQAVNKLRLMYNFVIIPGGEGNTHMWQKEEIVPELRPGKIKTIFDALYQTPDKWVDLSVLEYTNTQINMGVNKLRKDYGLNIINSYGLKKKKHYKLIGDTRNVDRVFVRYT